MIFHEKLPLRFDVARLRAGLVDLARLGDTVIQEQTMIFGGWSLQSDTGDWRRGFEPGAAYTRPTPDDGYEHAVAPHHYWKRTEACFGIYEEVLDELEDKGFHPHRARITVIRAGDSMFWHQDEEVDNYCVRLHIPIITNKDCAYEVKGEGHVHMEADGHAYLVDAATMHRAWNRGENDRVHFLADVWDTQGWSEHFVVSESRKSIQSYQQMIGYHAFMRATGDE